MVDKYEMLILQAQVRLAQWWYEQGVLLDGYAYCGRCRRVHGIPFVFH